MPAILDLSAEQDDAAYAKLAIIIASYAARHGGVAEALDLGGMLGIPAYSWEDGRDMLAAERTLR